MRRIFVRVKRGLLLSAALAVGAAVAGGTTAHAATVASVASGTVHAATVHGYPNATAYDEAVKLSHLKTVGTCAGYARSKFPDNEPSDVQADHIVALGDAWKMGACPWSP